MAWNESKIKQCESCQNSLNTHEENETHEICQAGICVLCFQCENIDCDSYKLKL